MKRVIILWAGLTGLCQVYSQAVTVTDAGTHDPLELVTITSRSPQVSTTTNARGQADLAPFRGSGGIVFRRVGYKTIQASFDSIRDASFRVEMFPARVNIDEVVVSATHWNQKTSEIPSRVISIPPRSVTLQNPQTAADMLGISGSVFIQKSQQGGGSPMIRGFATNRLLYSVDGVRMNTAIFRGGNIQNVISLDPFAMEHTEVLFGPGTVIYGSDAIGGVMSFQTLTPQFSLGETPLVTGKAVTRYASANQEKTGHVDINLGWKRWACVTSISSYEFGDLRMGSRGPDEYLRPFYVRRHDSLDVVITNADERIQVPSGYSQVNLMQKMRYRPAENWDLQYGFHYSETSDYARYDRHIRYRNGLPRYGEWNYGPQRWMMNNLSVTHRDENPFFDRFSFRLAEQRFEESRISRDFNDPLREIRIEQVDAWSANLDLTRSAGTGNTLFYGLEWVRDQVLSTGRNEDIGTGSRTPGPSRYPRADWSSYALYLSDQYNASEHVTLHSGLRYNRYLLNAVFDTTFYPFPFTSARLNNGALTGNLGIVYRPLHDWVFSTNLSTAFRSPNVDDVGKVFDSEPGSVTVPNPDLRAEYAYNADISAARVFGEVARLDLTAYYTLLNHAMVRRDYTLSGRDSILYDGEISRVQAIQNAARAHVYGIQGSAEFKLPAGFGCSSTFNFQRGEEELDDGTTSPSRHAPPWFGITRLTYEQGKIWMQLYAEYSGEKSFEEMPEEEKGKIYMYAVDANGNPYSPGWYTLNIKILYQLTGQFSLSAGMENLTDQRYRPYSSGIAGPGRNFILSFRANF